MTARSNKKIGTDFEHEVCAYLAQNGYWVHFIEPDASGAQPFDIIAVRNGLAIAIDCKTCVAGSIGVDRLEENQILAFEKWLECGNGMPRIAVKHLDRIFWVRYDELKERGRLKLWK